MTTQTCEGRFATGATLTAKLFNVIGDTLVATADTVTERTNRLGVYACAFGEAAVIAAGLYELVMYASGVPVSWQTVPLTGTDTETSNEGYVEQWLLDRTGYTMATIHGAISDAQTAAETYVITLNGITYTADYTGLDSSGNRTATTLSKA